MSSAGQGPPRQTPSWPPVVVTRDSRSDRLWGRAIDVLLFVLLLSLLALVGWFLLRLDDRAQVLEYLLQARLAGCICPGATPAP